MKKKRNAETENTNAAPEKDFLLTGMEAENFIEYSESEKQDGNVPAVSTPPAEEEVKPTRKRSKSPSYPPPEQAFLDHSGESLLRIRAEEDIKETEKKIEDRRSKDKNKRVKKFLKIALFIFLTVGSLLVVIPIVQSLSGDDVEVATLSDLFKNMDIGFFAAACGCCLIMVVILGVRNAYITRITSKKFIPLRATRIALLGKFYDNVTPLATGGQPFEIYELNKAGIHAGTATAIPLIRYFLQMFTVTPVSIALFAIFGNYLFDGTIAYATATTMSVFAYIGMGIFMIIPVFLIFVTVMPKLGMRLAGGIIKIGRKLKIVKDYDKAMSKAATMVAEFKAAMKYVSTNPVHLILLFLITIVETVVNYAIPFFLCVAFGNVAPTWELLFKTMTLNAYAFFAVSFMPTPGNAGFSESVFALIFMSIRFEGHNPMIWVVLMWRFLTYYIFIVIGLLIVVFDIIKSRLHKGREQKRGIPETEEQ